MPLPGFEELSAQVDRRAPRIPVVAAGGADRTVLEALSQAASRGWVQPIVTGSATEIERLAGELGIDLSPFRVLDSTEPATTAVAEIRAERAAMLMKGQIATPDLMRAVLHQEHGLRTGRTLCQIVLMEIIDQQRRFLLSDTGLCIRPEFRQKRQILESVVSLAHQLGLPRPLIAMMAASEKASESMPDTLESQEMQRLSEAGDLTGCVVQGPLSFDLAYAADAGDKKRIPGEVVGAADAMIFPDLLSANLTVKAIMYTANCRFGGVVSGAACPIIFMSRADTTETRLRSMALAIGVGN